MSIKFRAIQGGALALIVLYPICLIKDMGGLRYITFASFIAIFYTFIVLLVELPAYAHQNFNDPDYTLVYACFDWNLLTGMSITFLAYAVQAQVMPVYSELVNPNERRMKKVISRSVVIEMIFYFGIALAGYFSTYNYTQEIMLKRDPLDNQTIDYAILVAVFAIITVLIESIPVCYLPFRG